MAEPFMSPADNCTANSVLFRIFPSWAQGVISQFQIKESRIFCDHLPDKRAKTANFNTGMHLTNNNNSCKWLFVFNFRCPYSRQMSGESALDSNAFCLRYVEEPDK